ncbi:hypothetical protein PTSG_05945 [Salpingoeca rosetta]|uniref:Costars domain-containing protein n=1 Tax=Salpingoeca rosetta (strain ATCC 50818 / BSB-021) TaxID=946362 RepID=F2UD85_SALR5|nr:uncharacterized protein PTSG_05945 [Salpingoeca rosetta]EGD74580.1 hypothetical protein PTSG_05945 [Salpingoeca rosetta]|eukprot:XP_004992837.1 hypothetical protein PTSG_05945 [Salpingoeca rosetta]
MIVDNFNDFSTQTKPSQPSSSCLFPPPPPHTSNSIMDIDHEVGLLVKCMKRIGKEGDDGKIQVTFGEIFRDEVLEQQLESLVGTMKAARKRGLIDFKGQILLQGAHDDVVVTLLKDE